MVEVSTGRGPAGEQCRLLPVLALRVPRGNTGGGAFSLPLSFMETGLLRADVFDRYAQAVLS